jgi:hypothetical protein
MSHHFEFDRDNKVFCTSYEEELSLADFLSVGEETRRRILDMNPVAGMSDFSEVTSFALSSAEVRQMAETPPVYPPGIPRFVVAPRDYIYGMARMFQMFAEVNRPELQVVRTRLEAYKILGLQGMNFERM